MWLVVHEFELPLQMSVFFRDRREFQSFILTTVHQSFVIINSYAIRQYRDAILRL